MNVQLPLPHPLLGTWSTTQACALTGNRTDNPFICRLALSHTGQGSISDLSTFYLNFQLISHLWGDTLKLCKYPSSHASESITFCHNVKVYVSDFLDGITEYEVY